MANEKKNTNGEIENEVLTDEQANQAAGGYVRPTVSRPTEWDTCYLCQKRKNVDDMMYTVINGETRHVCCKCMGVR